MRCEDMDCPYYGSELIGMEKKHLVNINETLRETNFVCPSAINFMEEKGWVKINE